MSDPVPLPYGRDATSGRFTPGNHCGQGRAHAFAKQAAALRRAFFEAVTPEDMRALVRKLLEEAIGGNLPAARLVLLWVLGKPSEAVHPDGIEALVAAETEPDAGQHPPPLPQDRETHMRLAARELAEEMRAMRGELLDPGATVAQSSQLA